MLFNYVPYENHSIIKPYKTCIFKENNYCYVVYHSTAVVKFNEFEIILNSNGWETKTTKDRMNQTAQEYNLNYSVYQKDYIWYVNYGNKIYQFQDKIQLKFTYGYSVALDTYDVLNADNEQLKADEKETSRLLKHLLKNNAVVNDIIVNDILKLSNPK